MLSKTLKEWLRETEYYSSIFYERYVQAFSDPSCTKETGLSYCDIAKHNYNLRNVLQHIEMYGAYFAPYKCSACEHNEVNHGRHLHNTYTRYKKWIEQAIKNSDLREDGGYRLLFKNKQDKVNR